MRILYARTVYAIAHFCCLVTYLFNDHSSVPQEDQLVIDIFRVSNLARLFNHSCAGNSSTYKMYTETSATRIYQMGMYACRDIELGEHPQIKHSDLAVVSVGSPLQSQISP